MRADDFAERDGDLLLLFGGDAVEERQGQGAARNGFGDGKREVDRAGMTMPGGLQVDGREVTAGGDAARSEGCLDLITVVVDVVGQADHVDEPADFAVWKCERREIEAGDCAE